MPICEEVGRDPSLSHVEGVREDEPRKNVPPSGGGTERGVQDKRRHSDRSGATPRGKRGYKNKDRKLLCLGWLYRQIA